MYIYTCGRGRLWTRCTSLCAHCGTSRDRRRRSLQKLCVKRKQEKELIVLQKRWAMFDEFCDAWNEYLRIDMTWGNVTRDVVKGRVTVTSVKELVVGSLKVARGEFRGAGYEFVHTFNMLGSVKSTVRDYVCPCLKTLTCFLKFLKWDKTTRFKFKGLDDNFRDT